MKIGKFIFVFFALLMFLPSEARIKYTKATKTGMVANSEAYAGNNYKCLVKAIEGKKNIKLNGTFYISFPKSIELDYTLHIKDGEMRVCSGTAFAFVNGGGLNSSGTTFRRTNTNDAAPFIGGYDKVGAMKFSELVLDRCKFYGNQLMRIYFQDIDGSVTDFGIDRIIVRDSYFDNGGSITFIDGIIKETCEFSGNTYHGFPTTPIYICYSHSAKRYPGEAGAYRYVENNISRSSAISITDNTFEGKKVSLDYYYCAALVESVVCNFKHNTIRNIINYADGTNMPNATCYDAYLSCTEVYYENNSIEDMISYSRNGGQKPQCEIGKSKINILSEEGYKSVRKYIGNTYTVDGSRFLADGADENSLSVSICGNVEYIDDFEWTGNKIILKGVSLAGRSYSIGYGSFKFCDNIIKAKSISGSGLCMLSSKTDMNSVCIKGNDFDLESDAPFYLFNQVYDKGHEQRNIGDITIEGNTVHGTSPIIVFYKGRNISVKDNNVGKCTPASNIYISNYTGEHTPLKAEKMYVDWPCYTANDNTRYFDVDLSDSSKGVFRYHMPVNGKITNLLGSYTWEKDGEFEMKLNNSANGKETTVRIRLSNGKVSFKKGGKDVMLGTSWEQVAELDGIIVRARMRPGQEILEYSTVRNTQSQGKAEGDILISIDNIL